MWDTLLLSDNVELFLTIKLFSDAKVVAIPRWDVRKIMETDYSISFLYLNQLKYNKNFNISIVKP